MTDEIAQVMARAIFDARYGHGAYDQHAKSSEAISYKVGAEAAISALTSAGYVIMTTAERDGIRAAMAKEAGNAAVDWYGPYAVPEHAENLRSVILALAPLPAGYVCVPVVTVPNGITIDTIGGQCPVQAEGSVDRKPFYFRARGCRWSMSIGGEPISKPDWYYEQPYGTQQFEAGWMAENEAVDFINLAVEKYRAMTREVE